MKRSVWERSGAGSRERCVFNLSYKLMAVTVGQYMFAIEG